MKITKVPLKESLSTRQPFLQRLQAAILGIQNQILSTEIADISESAW